MIRLLSSPSKLFSIYYLPVFGETFNFIINFALFIKSFYVSLYLCIPLPLYKFLSLSLYFSQFLPPSPSLSLSFSLSVSGSIIIVSLWLWKVVCLSLLIHCFCMSVCCLSVCLPLCLALSLSLSLAISLTLSHPITPATISPF